MVASSIELDKCIGSDLTPILQKMSLTKNDEEHLKDVLKRKCESIKENLKKNYYKSGEQFAEDIKTMLFEFFQALGEFCIEKYKFPMRKLAKLPL